MATEQQARIDAILVWKKTPKIGSENMASQPDLNQLQDIVIDLAHKSVRPDTLKVGKILDDNMTPVIGAIIGSIGLTTALNGINTSNFEDGRVEFDIAEVMGAGYDLDINSDTSIEVTIPQTTSDSKVSFASVKPYNY